MQYVNQIKTTQKTIELLGIEYDKYKPIDKRRGLLNIGKHKNLEIHYPTDEIISFKYKKYNLTFEIELYCWCCRTDIKYHLSCLSLPKNHKYSHQSFDKEEELNHFLEKECTIKNIVKSLIK